MDSSIPDWTSLPRDLIALIGNHLLLRHSLVDLLRFRATCHFFRSSSPSPPQRLVPRFRILFTDPSTPGHGNHFLLTESAVYAINPLELISNNHETSNPTWLLKLEHSNLGKVRMRDTSWGYRSKSLPENLPKSFNLLDYRVQEITKAYRLELANKYKRTVRHDQIYKTWPTCFLKVVVSTTRSEIMAIHGKLRKAFLLRSGDEKWTQIDVDCDHNFRDIVYHNKKFYAVDNRGVTIVVDSNSFGVTSIQKPNSCQFPRNLVKSSDDLFFIVGYGKDQKDRLAVYRLDEKKLEWVPVTDELEDRALFVGTDCSFSLSTKEFSGYKGNCVYFIHDFGKLETEFQFVDLKDGILADFDPGYSNLFWPPPTWMKNPNSSSSWDPSPSPPLRRPPLS